MLLISAAVAALFGALKGATATRLRGDYLAVATLALGLLTADLIANGGALTGGASGLSVIPPPHLFGLIVASPSAQYYLVLFFVLLAALVSGRLIASRTGRAWIASSEDETAAVSFGIDASRYRVLAFVFSSALAGIAGALYASTFSYIDPTLAAFDISSLMLAMVILGGAGSVGGAVLGTALIYFYDKIFVPAVIRMADVALAARCLYRHGAQPARHELFRFRHCVVFDGAMEGEEKIVKLTNRSAFYFLQVSNNLLLSLCYNPIPKGDYMLQKFVSVFGGDPNKRTVEKLAGIVDEINSLEAEFEQLSDEALRAKTEEFKSKIKSPSSLRPNSQNVQRDRMRS